MKKRYTKKISIITCIVALCTYSASAQEEQEQVTVGSIYSTGGIFQGANNYVKIGLYESLEFNANLGAIDSVLGDFSNFVSYQDHRIFFHVGRSNGHIEGEDEIRIYIPNGDFGVINNVGGAKALLATGNKAAIIKGFGATNGKYLELFSTTAPFDKLYSDSLNSSTGGLAYNDSTEQLFVSYTETDTGKVVSYDLSGEASKLGTVFADTALKGIKAIFYVSDLHAIVGVSKDAFFDNEFNEIINSAYIFRYDLTSGQLLLDSVPDVGSSIKFVEGSLVGDFGNGLAVFDAEAFDFLFNPLTTINHTDFAIDIVNQELFTINTDFFSFGEIKRSELFTGGVIDSSAVDISGTAIDVIHNLVPIANNDSVVLDRNSSIIVDPRTNDVDADNFGELNFYVPNLTTSNGSVEVLVDTATFISQGISYMPNNDFVGVDSVTYVLTDAFDVEATATVYFYVEEPSAIKEHQVITIQAYPNPTSNYLQFRGNDNQALGNVSIVDVTGKEVLNTFLKDVHSTLDVSSLSGGTYFILFKDEPLQAITFEKR